jgi:hypothetical protein
MITTQAFGASAISCPFSGSKQFLMIVLKILKLREVRASCMAGLGRKGLVLKMGGYLIDFRVI